ncbi:MAG: sulfotransferase family 2 domain-containing protein [Deltaproteobacteria bacterium]|nr:sulfotransferase family 2 domain-containing protein [Deltaproteobacteria bacterium]
MTLIFSDKKVNLFLNPKVATSTIKIMCLANMAVHLFDDLSSLDIHDETRHLPNHGSQFGTSQFFGHLNAPGVRNFLFVRNPYTRLTSAYLDKIAAPKRGCHLYEGKQGAIFHFAQKHHLVVENELGHLPFETFVRWVIKTPNHKLNIHWALQSDLSMFGKVRYSDIAKLEDNFQSGLENLMQALDFKFNKHIPQKANAGSIKPSKSLYTAETAALVYKKFKPDFKIFNYDVDSWR